MIKLSYLPVFYLVESDLLCFFNKFLTYSWGLTKNMLAFDLCNTICVALLSRILLMDLILACSNCFFFVDLTIFLASSVLKVVFSVRLTDTNSVDASKGEYHMVFIVAVPN